MESVRHYGLDSTLAQLGIAREAITRHDARRAIDAADRALKRLREARTEAAENTGHGSRSVARDLGIPAEEIDPEDREDEPAMGARPPDTELGRVREGSFSTPSGDVYFQDADTVRDATDLLGVTKEQHATGREAIMNELGGEHTETEAQFHLAACLTCGERPRTRVVTYGPKLRGKRRPRLERPSSLCAVCLVAAEERRGVLSPRPQP